MFLYWRSPFELEESPSQVISTSLARFAPVCNLIVSGREYTCKLADQSLTLSHLRLSLALRFVPSNGFVFSSRLALCYVPLLCSSRLACHCDAGPPHRPLLVRFVGRRLGLPGWEATTLTGANGFASTTRTSPGQLPEIVVCFVWGRVWSVAHPSPFHPTEEAVWKRQGAVRMPS